MVALGETVLDKAAAIPSARRGRCGRRDRCVETSGGPGTLPLVNNLYQGMAIDPVTGLYYERARWYSPSLGTWISQDPAGYINGADTYQFVTGEPVGKVDPSGRTVIGVGVSGGIEAGPVNVVGGAFVTAGSSGPPALDLTLGGGGGAGVGEYVNVGVTASDAISTYDMAGPFGYTSGFGGLGGGGGAEVYYGSSPNGPVVGATSALGDDVGGGIGNGWTYTFVIPLSLGGILRDISILELPGGDGSAGPISAPSPGQTPCQPRPQQSLWQELERGFLQALRTMGPV